MKPEEAEKALCRTRKPAGRSDRQARVARRPSAVSRLCRPPQASRRPSRNLGAGGTLSEHGEVFSALGSSERRSLATPKRPTFADIFRRRTSSGSSRLTSPSRRLSRSRRALTIRGRLRLPPDGLSPARLTDQVRMAAVSRATLRLSGLHAGISIGADGVLADGPRRFGDLPRCPRQRRLPLDSWFHRPPDQGDGRPPGRLLPALHPRGHSALYGPDETIPGSVGLKTLSRSSGADIATVIGAGVTLHEAPQGRGIKQLLV